MTGNPCRPQGGLQMQGVSSIQGHMGTKRRKFPSDGAGAGETLVKTFFGGPLPCCPVGQAHGGGCPELGQPCRA